MNLSHNIHRKRKVAVIGAGVAGLCCLKHLAEELDTFDFVAFEQNSVPGGLWNYTDQSEYDDFGLPVHNAELMIFPGFPYPSDWTKSYLHRSKVLEYINSFVDHYDIRKYVKVHTLVTNVAPLDINADGPVQWRVDTVDVRQRSDVTTHTFDAVLVCNGQFSNAFIPDIPGKETFRGRIIHSKNYRKAIQFENQAVAVLGCRYSGQDISMEVAKFAKKVYACHNMNPENFPPTFPKEIEQRPPFVEIKMSSVVFADGEEVEVDAIIFCTGYRYSFPFLNSGLISIENERITPIYKHMVHITYPNLIFIGIPRFPTFFPHYHEMSKLAILILSGKVEMPSREDMILESDRDFLERSMNSGGEVSHAAHFFGTDGHHMRFNVEIAELGGFERLPRFIEYLIQDVIDERRNNLKKWRELDYDITGEDCYRCLQPDHACSRFSKR